MSDISVVVLAHAEGRMLAHTLKSVAAATALAAEHQLQTEILVMLDSATTQTRAVVLEFPGKLQVHETVFGDPGLARNEAIRLARGRWIALIDGDDLWGEDWLWRAAESAVGEASPSIWHPEVSQYFGLREDLLLHQASADLPHLPFSMLEHNPWTVSVFTSRAVLLEIPFVATSVDDGIGHEDWIWQCDSIAAGVAHQIVPETVHFVRSRRESRSQQASRRECCMVPSARFCAHLLQCAAALRPATESQTAADGTE